MPYRISSGQKVVQMCLFFHPQTTWLKVQLVYIQGRSQDSI